MSHKFLLIVIAIILLLPVVAYIYQFGFGLWQEPSQWSDLGGYIGGIYTPILTILTLSVLCVQIYLQIIQYRQQLVSLQEEQLSDYLKELNLELDKTVDEDVTLRNEIINVFNHHNLESIQNMDLSVISELNQNYHKLYSMWCGAMGCLEHIKISSELKNLESAHYFIQKNKTIAYMGPQVCSALDKNNFAVLLFIAEKHTGQSSTENREYEFWLDKEQP